MKRHFPVLVGMMVTLVGSTGLRAAEPVIVHEWGTFTSLQDEKGEAIKGINVDDEPVPSFVYENAGITVTSEYSLSEKSIGLPPYRDRALLSQGWFTGDPQVTLRLETPVLYIYQPKGETPQSVPPLDVHVDFHGGILSQAYPFCQREVPCVTGRSEFKGITGDMTTGLTWQGVRLGSTVKPVETDEKVWTTPREVSAPVLEVKAPIYEQNGLHEGIEAEHFLFYRGIGHLDSPLRRGWPFAGLTGTVGVASPRKFYFLEGPNQKNGIYSQGWYTEIRSNGICAFSAVKSLGNSERESGPSPFPVIASFSEGDFSANNLAKLKAYMQEALVKEGLYPDEASAMLRTWELSYFKSPGLRFFYIVPHEWVDRYLPLKITGAPTEITRVMVGRIELITDEQRAALARLAVGPCPDLASVKKAVLEKLESGKLPKAEVDAFYRGERPLTELGISIPPLVADYLSLGRFRDALIVHEQAVHPSGALAEFIKTYRLVPGK